MGKTAAVGKAPVLVHPASGGDCQRADQADQQPRTPPAQVPKNFEFQSTLQVSCFTKKKISIVLKIDVFCCLFTV